MDCSSPHQGVRLPETVERIIKRICEEKKQAPLRKDARSMLAEIGEKASMELLSQILSTKSAIFSFSGYVIHLVKKNGHKIQPAKSLTAYSSPSSVSPHISPHKLNGQSLQSPSSDFQKKVPQNLCCELSFDDETQEKRNSGFRCQSSLAGKVRETSEPKISQQLMILSKLEFRRLFLVLSYIGGQKLEDVVTLDGANEIYSMKDTPMEVFETQIWNTYGHKYCGSKSDRSLNLGWDSGKTHIYSCHGPYLNSTRTHLQRSLGDDKILAVKFSEDGTYLAGPFVEEGIHVVFKDERKRVKKNQTENEKKASYSSVKCYFVRTDSFAPCGSDENYILSRKKISEARRLFMHIHTVSTLEKYIARFSLILSKTIKLEVNFAAVSVEKIEDIPFQDENGLIIHDEDGKPILHTDGTGYISEDLAMMCPKDFSTAKAITDNSFEKHDQNVSGDIASQKRAAETRNMEPVIV
ncbi:probable RNA-dependent RNA polymerase 5 [Phtheirospermum japonicum]|uniref:RNA-dependent RNA polymerase n=1 Tax=Phtheirospermum japonicum TaxID=374723 RepID=A0A830BRN0_9LAMI|nr:probable RNA-dependent RNA polymerase 5 [Phtheirospermum japonicum]